MRVVKCETISCTVWVGGTFILMSKRRTPQDLFCWTVDNVGAESSGEAVLNPNCGQIVMCKIRGTPPS